ncbi:MAG: HPr family phosphocarrier protein [Kiritimatiellia bacterium]|nr:HPr family phosphocarrier protein [Kiritimatiellia bacterium]
MADSTPKKPAVITREMAILNQYGIHARPAAMFVKTASKYEADVTVERDNVRVSGKSIMGLMTMEASCGSKIRITAEGIDANQAVDELQKLVEHKFYEE